MTASRAPAPVRMYPVAARGALDCELAAELRDALASEHVSHDAVAAQLGVSRQRVDRYCDPHAPENTPRLRVSELRALAEIAPATCERILAPVERALGKVLVEVPAVEASAHAADDARAAAFLARTTTEAALGYVEASVDGTLDPRERSQLRPLVRAALVALLALDRRIAADEDAAREGHRRGVVPIGDARKAGGR